MPKNTKQDVFQYIDMTGGTDACWPWTKSTGGGSGKGKPRPYFQYDSTKVIAYRLVYELVHGVTLSSETFIRHKCDNPICCNPAHMETGTHQENMDDMVARDRHGLSHIAVRRIRWMLATRELTHAEIAALNETSASTVGRIARNELHTHENDYIDNNDSE